MACDGVQLRLGSVDLVMWAVTAPAEEPRSIAAVKTFLCVGLCKLLCTVSCNWRNRCQSSSDLFWTHHYKLILLHVLHLFSLLFFLRPCKNSNRRKLSVLGQYDFWQYLLCTTKRQLEKVNQVTSCSVEVWMHLFLKRVHCAWHKQAVTPFLTRHHIPVHAASLLLLFLHVAEFKHRSPMLPFFCLLVVAYITLSLCWPRRRTKSNVRWTAPIHKRKKSFVSQSWEGEVCSLWLCYFGETIGPSHR